MAVGPGGPTGPTSLQHMIIYYCFDFPKGWIRCTLFPVLIIQQMLIQEERVDEQS